MKGIILAGGTGTRLYPLTLAMSKQLLPVYDKPMIYYPLSILMLAGIREILIISTPDDLPRFRQLLGTGSRLGLEISYAEQAKPDGIASAFRIGRSFIGTQPVCLILGDNIFFGHDLQKIVKRSAQLKEGAIIFGYHVRDPQRYGVVEFDAARKIISIEEKPHVPRSQWAIPGLYFYDNDVVDIACSLKASARGEFEITDIHQEYLNRGRLQLELLGRGFAWLDAGTHDALLAASTYVQAVQHRQGMQIACVEEIAYRQGYISRAELRTLGKEAASSSCGQYLIELADAQGLS